MNINIGARIENKFGENAIIMKTEPKFQLLCEDTGSLINTTKATITKGTWRCPVLKKKWKEKQDELKKISKKTFKNHSFEIVLNSLDGLCLVLDQSKNHSGIMVIHINTGKITEYESYIENDVDHIISVNKILGRIQYYTSKYDIKFIGIEGTYLDTGFGGATTFEKLVYLKNAIIQFAYKLEKQITVVPSKSWKSEYNIHGKNYEERKIWSLERIKDYLPESITINFTDDLADCYFIFMYIKENRITLL